MNLKRFLENEVLPWYEKRYQELEYRPLIRAQAFEAVNPGRLERLARYEVHLDRKLERVLAMCRKGDECGPCIHNRIIGRPWLMAARLLIAAAAPIRIAAGPVIYGNDRRQATSKSRPKVIIGLSDGP